VVVVSCLDSAALDVVTAAVSVRVEAQSCRDADALHEAWVVLRAATAALVAVADRLEQATAEG
jgi:hypothetical protein